MLKHPYPLMIKEPLLINLAAVKVQMSFDLKKRAVLKLRYVVLQLPSLLPVSINFDHTQQLWQKI